MSTRIVFLVLTTAVAATTCQAQDDPPVRISLDLLNRTTDTVERTVDQNGTVIVTVENVNLFLYNVSLTERQNNAVNSTLLNQGNARFGVRPATFGVNDLRLNIPSIAVPERQDDNSALGKQVKAVEDSLDKAYQALDVFQRQLTFLEEDITALGLLNAEEQRLNNRAVELDAALEATNRLVSGAEEDNRADLQGRVSLIQEEQGQVETDLSEVRNSIDSYSDSTEILKAQRSELRRTKIPAGERKARDLEDQLTGLLDRAEDVTSQVKTFKRAVTAYREALRRLEAVIDYEQRLRCLAYDPGRSSKQVLEQKAADAQEFIGQPVPSGYVAGRLLASFHSARRQVETQFEAVEEAYSRLSGGSPRENIRDAFVRIAALHERLPWGDYNAFFEHIVALYTALNEGNFSLTYSTNVITDNADEIAFELLAVPVEGLSCSLPPAPVREAYVVKVKNGVKVDFSTGLIANAFLSPSTYRFQSSTKDNSVVTKVVESKAKDFAVPSIGLLLHIYRRGAWIAGTVGASTDGASLRYYSGASILLGRSQRFVFSAGLALGQVLTVKDEFKAETTVDIPLDQLPDPVPLESPSPYRPGLFFGFTFNLSDSSTRDAWSRTSAVR